MAREDGTAAHFRKDQYDAVVLQIEREEALINTRLRWMLTFEGFLFAARALQLKNANESFHHVTSALGIAVAVLGLLGTVAANSALADTKKFFRTHLSKDSSLLRPYGARPAQWLGIFTALGISLAPIVAWAWLLSGAP